MRGRPPEAPTTSTDEPVCDEDALGGQDPSTDDTPTIITKNAAQVRSATQPPPTFVEDSAAGIRGRRLAHFELIEPIGVGGMAAVIRARDTQLDRFVALKILPPEMAQDSENVRRFHQEARSAAKLDHENIARVFFCGEDQRLHFIAFEFVEGDNLRMLLERRGRLPVGEAVHYMLQVAAGLAHAIRRGVVHRDIKPSNIIITPNGRAKLVDMGLARSLERRTDDDLTQSGVTLGTFDYISPEQALEPRDADVRSDIYSLGCTFYHVLTGRPPVPEGTAAKKLHHHQHVRPTDPREFVPDLPVEVVQILDRMIAKNPRERFQSPEQLVQALLAVARKLGTGSDIPEGVLSVETSLPSAPPSRPLVWAAVSAVAVVVVVLVLDQVPNSPSDPQMPSDARAEKQNPANNSKGNSGVARGPETGPPTSPGDGVRDEHRYIAPENPTARHLVQWLEQHQDAPWLELQLAGDLDLSFLQGERTRSLMLKASRQIILKPRDPGQKVTLRFSYDGGSHTDALVALTVDAPETQIEGIRFVVDAHGAEKQMTSLMLLGRKHQVQRCEFIQAQPSLSSEHPFTSLVARAGDRARGEVSLSDCVFLGFGKAMPAADREAGPDVMRPLVPGLVLSEVDAGGHRAISREGAIRILADNCVFGPHVSAFRIEGAIAGDPGALALRNCTLMLPPRRSSAFDCSSEAQVRLDVRSSLFSRCAGDTDDGAVLIRQSEDRAGAVLYQGQDNCYHDLDGFWTIRDSWQKAGWRDFRRRLSGENRDDGSRLLMASPWEIDWEQQRALLEKDAYAAAFHLNLRLPELRRTGRGGPDDLIGAVRIVGDAWGPRALPRLDEKTEPNGPRFLVVEPSEEGGTNAPGVHGSLGAAIAVAHPGDTILLRHQGELGIDPVLLGKQGLRDLTIKPARRFRPVLTLGELTDSDVSMFRLYDGRLRLEGLEFRLRSGKRDPRSQTVLSLYGDGECLFKDCAITLQRGGETSVTLATLAETGKFMKTDLPGTRSRDQGPRLTLENCFIRGDGDLLASRANRPFSLDIKESLVALAGSVVNLDLAPDQTMPPTGQEMRLALDRATTYLGGHLVRLSSAKDPRGLVPLRCRAENSLFLPASTSKTLVQLEGPDSDDKGLRDKFTWKDGRQNAYGGYTSLLTQDSTDGMAAPMGMDRWKMLPGEEASTFNVKMERLPPTTTSFTSIEAGQFRVPKTLSDVGAPTSLPAPLP
ncbi:MAG: serine/threonine-protein kinase [Gemmataceae bacterium]